LKKKGSKVKGDRYCVNWGEEKNTLDHGGGNRGERGKNQDVNLTRERRKYNPPHFHKGRKTDGAVSEDGKKRDLTRGLRGRNPAPGSNQGKGMGSFPRKERQLCCRQAGGKGKSAEHRGTGTTKKGGGNGPDGT